MFKIQIDVPAAYGRFLLNGGAMMLALILAPAAMADEAREGWNLPGGDYHWYALDHGDTAIECASACAADDRCRAWTYKYAMGGEPPLCFLKESVPAWRNDERFFSGIRDADPVIGEGGDWECVGEGCDGDDAPPASASYQLLPVFRLPGNDLYMLDAGDGMHGWMDCRQACTEDARCGAWTWRAPSGQCLIKSRAGIPIPDPCCQSGIKR